MRSACVHGLKPLHVVSAANCFTLLKAHWQLAGDKLRAVGSALSPNGLGFADGDGHDMVSLALMDKVVEVDRVSGRARVQVLPVC